MQPDLPSYVPSPDVCTMFKICRRTLSRWTTSRSMGFPSPSMFNGRLYFKKTDLEKWLLAHAPQTGNGGAAGDIEVANLGFTQGER